MAKKSESELENLQGLLDPGKLTAGKIRERINEIESGTLDPQELKNLQNFAIKVYLAGLREVEKKLAVVESLGLYWPDGTSLLVHPKIELYGVADANVNPPRIPALSWIDSNGVAHLCD